MANSNEDVIGKVQEITTKAMEDAVHCISGIGEYVSEYVKAFGIAHFQRIILNRYSSSPIFAREQTGDLGAECFPTGKTTVSGGNIYGLIATENNTENSGELKPPSPRR